MAGNLSPRYPSLDLETLRTGYEMLAQSEHKKLSPLAGLVLVQAQLNSPTALKDLASHNEVVYELLASLLIDEFSMLRSQYQLAAISVTAPSSLQAGIQDLGQCGKTGNTRLVGYALLYYRYIRSDLELSVQAIGDYLNYEARGLRRYNEEALDSLLGKLINLERQARARRHNILRQLALPQYPIIGLATHTQLVIDTANEILESPFPYHLYIWGTPSIGKSTLALQIVKNLNVRPYAHEIVWLNFGNLDTQPTDTETIADLICEALHLRPTHETNQSSQLIQQYLAYLMNDKLQLLIVLDNADGWQIAITEAWSWLGQCALIVTASAPSEHWLTSQIRCPELNLEDSFTFLENLETTFTRGNRKNQDAAYRQVIQQVGGNPSNLKRAYHLLDSLAPNEIMDAAALQNHYRFQWERAPEFCRELFWWVVVFSQNEYVNKERLLLVSTYFFSPQDITLNQALNYWVKIGWLECNISQNPYLYQVIDEIWQSIAQIPSALDLLYQIAVQVIQPSNERENTPLIVANFFMLVRRLNLKWLKIVIPLARIGQSEFIKKRHWQGWLNALQWLDEELGLTDDGKAWIKLEKTITLRRLGKLSEAEAQVLQVSYLANFTEDTLMLSDALIEHSILLFYKDDHALAFEKAQKAYEILKDSDDEARYEKCLYVNAQALTRSNPMEARQWAQAITRRDAEVWDLIARIELTLDPKAALVAAQRSLATLTPENPAYPRSLGLVARALSANGEMKEAINTFHLAINLLQSQHDPVGLARMHNNLGAAYTDFAKTEKVEYLDYARQQFEYSLQLCQTIRDEYGAQIAAQNLQGLDNNRPDGAQFSHDL